MGKLHHFLETLRLDRAFGDPALHARSLPRRIVWLTCRLWHWSEVPDSGPVIDCSI